MVAVALTAREGAAHRVVRSLQGGGAEDFSSAPLNFQHLPNRQHLPEAQLQILKYTPTCASFDSMNRTRLTDVSTGIPHS